MSDDDAKAVERLKTNAEHLVQHGCLFDPNAYFDAIAMIGRLTADNARLAAEVERLTLRWSSERPKVVGEYLLRCKSSGLREENLFLDDDDTPIAWDDDWEFAGPIVVQEPPKPA